MCCGSLTNRRRRDGLCARRAVRAKRTRGHAFAANGCICIRVSWRRRPTARCVSQAARLGETRAMRFPLGEMIDALRCASWQGLRLALKDRHLARQYCSYVLQRYDELMGHGPVAMNPLNFIYQQGWSPRVIDDRVEVPINIHTGGGVRLDELVILAMVARALRPAKVFEIGTFMGRTTTVLLLNTPPTTEIVTLDLPPDADLDAVTSSGCLD